MKLNHQRTVLIERTKAAVIFVFLIASLGLTFAKPRPPGPPMPAVGRIFSESFDQPYGFAADQVIDPSIWSESWSGYCLERSSSSVLPWAIPMMVTNHALIDASVGAVRFWYRPHLDSGSGPELARLLTLVSTSGGTSANWWTLGVTRDGKITLLCQDGQQLVPCLSAAASFKAGDWALVTFCYSPTNCLIYWNDALVTSGDGVPSVPSQVIPYTSLIIGSAADGTEVAAGQIDELDCFSGNNRFRRMTGHPFGLSVEWDIVQYWQSMSPIAAMGPITPEEEAAKEQLRAQRRAQRLAAQQTLEGGDGPLDFGPPPGCGTNLLWNVWLTNIVCTNIQGQGWTVSFQIAGGTNGALYDVFGTSALTNSSWVWLTNGYACDTITITNQWAEGGFYRLGIPLDSDRGGRTDAYERLVSYGDVNDPADDYPMPPGMSVGVLDSQLTRNHWSATAWNYFVMPESVKEALRSDGTPFTVVGDTTIAKGLLTNGLPKFPILISLAAESIADNEIGPLTNYVAAGGFLLVGSSSFTRDANGNRRSAYPLASQIGMDYASVTNWVENTYLAPETDHRLINHIPGDWVTWRLPSSAEEISWGTCQDSHPYSAPHLIWPMSVSDAEVVASGDSWSYPYIAVKPYGKGYFIYHAAMQPLIGHGGHAPSMHAYVIFKRAIEWAFESAARPVARLSPWPYQYNSAFMVRHDFENFADDRIPYVKESAQYEHQRGVKGDYYFCTGSITNRAFFDSIISGLHEAVTNYGATIAPHNGGLANPRLSSDTNSPCHVLTDDYYYFHWGLDEALDVSNGKAYALESMRVSFAQMESWLTNIQSGPRLWVAPFFNATREDSFDIQEQLGVKITGDQKLTPFPHWTVSTRTDGKRYSFLSQPVSDWFVERAVAQSLEPWQDPHKHDSQTMHAGVDFYYMNGFLVNFYSHTRSDGLPLPTAGAGDLVPDYINYCLSHSNIWSANAKDVYYWWVDRSGARITASHATNGSQVIATADISGAQNTNTAVEFFVHGGTSGLLVLRNGAQATTNDYRVIDEIIKVRVGTSVTNVEVRYTPAPKPPKPQDDAYSTNLNQRLSVPAPGVLGNDAATSWTNLTVSVSSSPANGTLYLTNNGGFSYQPNPNFFGRDCFSYSVSAGTNNFGTANVTIFIVNTNYLFHDDFRRCGTPPFALTPWQVYSGSGVPGQWTLGDGIMQGTSQLGQYGYSYLNGDWANYSVEAGIKFPAGVWGGGIGGRLGAGGAHYAAWIYPEGSGGGSNVLKLIKFSSWTGFDIMQTASLASVGTNWHTLKLSMNSTNIAVYYDDLMNPKISTTDNNSPYSSGGVTLDMWTTESGPVYYMSVSNLIVKPSP